MASLEVFARRIQRRARQVEVGASDAVKLAALAINQVLILETPVDTGRARANWQVGLAAPIRDDTEAVDPSGINTIAKNRAIILARRNRVDIIISNNLPYIGQLNQGSSAQAPAGFVEKAVLVGLATLSRHRVLRSR